MSELNSWEWQIKDQLDSQFTAVIAWPPLRFIEKKQFPCPWIDRSQTSRAEREEPQNIIYTSVARPVLDHQK